MGWKIPLFKIYWDDEDIEMVNDAIQRGMFWAIGPNIEKFEKMLSDYVLLPNEVKGLIGGFIKYLKTKHKAQRTRNK